MQIADAESWRLSVDEKPFLPHIALYIRDACHLVVPPDPIVPPRVLGEVVNHVAEVGDGRQLAGEQWIGWWKAIAGSEAGRALAVSSPTGPNGERLAAGVRDLVDSPALSGLAERPALREAVRVSYEDAARWHSELARDCVRPGHAERQARSQVIRSIAERLTARLGVHPGELRASVLVLATESGWSILLSPGFACCSVSIARDPPAFAELIESAFISGLEA